MISLSTIYRHNGIILLLTAFPTLYIPLLLFSHFATHGLQQTRLPCPSLSPRVCPDSCSLSWWCHPTMSSSVTSSPLALTLSQHQGLFQGVSSSKQVAKVLKFHLQHQSFQWICRTDFLEDGLVWFPCSSRDSQESSLAPQFESISSSALNLLGYPTLTSICDFWKNRSFDYMDLCQQSDASRLCFLLCKVVSLPRNKHLNFMATVDNEWEPTV